MRATIAAPVGMNCPSPSRDRRPGGGTLQAAGEQLCLHSGEGSFNQVGGTNDVTILSLIGQLGAIQSQSSASYTLGGGTLSATTITVGTGNYDLQGGTPTMSGSVTVSTDGAFAFDDGILATNSVTIGGGAVMASGDAHIAPVPAGAVLAVTQNGGSNTINSGTLVTDGGPGASEFYTLSGGTVAALNEMVSADVNSLTSTATASVAGTLGVAGALANAGMLTLDGGTVEAAGWASAAHSLCCWQGSSGGLTGAGYADNFARGDLTIDSDQRITLGAGVGGSDLAFY
ncbi:MAG: hypothetical protein ACREFY_12580, partial [Acetobacteraceae bacterium]